MGCLTRNSTSAEVWLTAHAFGPRAPGGAGRAASTLPADPHATAETLAAPRCRLRVLPRCDSGAPAVRRVVALLPILHRSCCIGPPARADPCDEDSEAGPGR